MTYISAVPMEYVIVCLVAFLSSAMTLYSGFGLGSVLLLAFAIFSTLPIAVALTAIIHFLNNLFKLSLLFKHARSFSGEISHKWMWSLASLFGCCFQLTILLTGVGPT